MAIDDHSRLSYVEVLPDQTGAQCAAFLDRAVGWFAAQGVTCQRVMSDNGSGYVSRGLCRALSGAGAAAPADAAVYASHQREGRALHPDPATRVGLRTPLRDVAGAATGAPSLAALLQPGTAARQPELSTAHHSTVVCRVMNNVLVLNT